MFEHWQTIIEAGGRSSICMYRFRYQYQSAASVNTESLINNDFIGQPNLRFADNDLDFIRMMIREEDPDTLTTNCKLKVIWNCEKPPKTTRQCEATREIMR